MKWVSRVAIQIPPIVASPPPVHRGVTESASRRGHWDSERCPKAKEEKNEIKMGEFQVTRIVLSLLTR